MAHRVTPAQYGRCMQQPANRQRQSVDRYNHHIVTAPMQVIHRSNSTRRLRSAVNDCPWRDAE